MKSQTGESLNNHPFVEALRWFNVGLRGIMEFGIVAAMAYWGYRVGSNLIIGILIGILAPLIVFGFWGLVDFHQAGHVAEPLRLVEELIICGLVTAALFVSGQPVFALIFGLIAIVQHGLVYLLGDTLLKKR